MSVTRSSYRMLFALGLVAVGASTASAQRRLFQWRGEVDREVLITMRGRDVWTRDIGNNDTRRSREQVMSALPRENGWVVVRLEDGRGDADVVQQPTARNGYTAVVRIRDSRGGSDRYRIDALWEPASNGRYDRRGDRDNNDGGWDYDRNRGTTGRDGGIDSRDRTGNDRNDRGPWGGADTRNVLHWSGNVDDVLEIRMQDQRVEYRTLSGQTPRNVQANANGIPQRELDLRVAQREGRGEVFIVQQPSSRNGYTAIIRIRDPQGGYGFYNFDLTW